MIDNPKLCRLSYWGKIAISFSLNALGLLEVEYTLWPYYGTGDASRPPPFGDPSAETYVDPIAAVDPPPSTSSDSSLRAMLDTVMTV